jgi:hypothetical protein
VRPIRTTTPPSNMHPTIVVPVLVALGRGTPLACSAALRVWLEKSKPGILTNGHKEPRLESGLKVLTLDSTGSCQDSRIDSLKRLCREIIRKGCDFGA